MKKPKFNTYCVILKNGSDYRVRATSKSDAIKRVMSGKGKLIGAYECSPATRAMAFIE